MVAHQNRTEDLQQASFLTILVIVSLLMAVIVYPFAQPLLWAALAAIMFQPLYRYVLRRMRGRRNPAAGISLLIIFTLVLVPAGWIATMVIQQAIVLVATLQQQPIDLAALFDVFYTSLPKIAREAVDRSGWADIATVQSRLQELLAQSAGMIASQAVSIGSGALGFFLSFGVGLYVMFFLLRDGERIGRTVLCAMPVERSIADRLAERFLGIVRATIKGTGVVALVQGALGWITLMIAGVPSALLFGVLMTIFALVPVIGAGAVWLPAGLWLLVTGATWQQRAAPHPGGPRHRHPGLDRACHHAGRDQPCGLLRHRARAAGRGPVPRQLVDPARTARRGRRGTAARREHHQRGRLGTGSGGSRLRWCNRSSLPARKARQSAGWQSPGLS